MRVSFTLASAFSAAMFNTALNGNLGAVSAQRRFGVSEYIVSVRSCDEFPGNELDVHGTVSFLRDIECREPTVMHVEKDLLLRSHAVLDTKNLHFVVHQGATLTLRAPAILIAREQGSTVPLFDVSGKLTFEAASSIPGLVHGSLEDDGGVVRVMNGGTVDTAQQIRHYADSIIVVAEPGQELDDPDRLTVELSPALKASLAEFHAKLEAAPDDAPPSPPTSSISPTSTFSSSDSSTSSYKSEGNGRESDASFLTSYFDMRGGPGERHSAPFRHAPADTSTKNAEDDTVRHTASYADPDDITRRRSPGAGTIADTIPAPTPSSTAIPNPGSTQTSGAPGTAGSPISGSSRSPSTTTNPGSPSTSNSNSRSPDSSSHGHGQSHNHSPTPASAHTPDSPGSHHGGSNDDQAGSQSNSNRASGPKLALRVGEVLDPSALSLSGKSILWPAEDGSIVFRKVVETPPGITESEGGVRTVTTVMVDSDASSLRRVFLARMALRKEKREGDVSGSRKGWGGAWAWLPWRRQHLQDVERARERLGQVEMTLDDRAGVEVSVDGTRVVARSGSSKREWVNRFPWRRRKNKDYELYVSEEGFEVKLGERRIWGVTADMIE